MRRYEVSFDRDATADLLSIRNHIAKARGEDFAEAFASRVIEYCERLADLPHRGTRHDEIRPGLRTVAWRKTMTIAFRVSDEPPRVPIVALLYRGRDVLAALRAKS